MSTPPCFCLSQSPSTLRRLRPGPRPRQPVLASGRVRSRVLGFLVLGSVVVLGCIVSVGWLDGRTTQVTSPLPKLCVLFLLKRKERLCCALAGARSAAERAPKCTRTKRTGSGRRGSSRHQYDLLKPYTHCLHTLTQPSRLPHRLRIPYHLGLVTNYSCQRALAPLLDKQSGPKNRLCSRPSSGMP
jgi:hypothetical protein